MGIKQYVQFRTCQKLGILLIFFVAFGFCMSGFSSSSEVARCELNSDLQNSNNGSFSGFKAHIMKFYFEKYENMLKSNFQDFIADELRFGSCELLPDNLNLLLRLSISKRHLIGEGSHRHLSSTIRFGLQPESFSQLPNHYCKVIIVESLPFGVFADPFELQHLLERGVFSDVAVFGDTNLELPSVLSNLSVVEIHMNIGQDSLYGHINELEIGIDVPIHARYPPLDDSGYSKVEFGEPDLFMHCCVEGNLNNQSCLFMLRNNSDKSKIGAIEWRIPAGIRAHARVVSAVTFAAASISTLLIVLTSWLTSNIKLCKILKKS